MITLRTQSSTFRVHDESGYEFEIVTGNDPECGWSAQVHVQSFGMNAEQAAIDKLLFAVEQLLRIAKEPNR